MYIMTPAEKQSTLKSYFLLSNISGAIKPGVPHLKNKF